jgi:hypothetical protein
LNIKRLNKQAYEVFKAVKHFRPYLLKSKTRVVVPYPVVRNLLVKKYLREKRDNWMTTLQEYNLKIIPANIVKGKGLCKLAVESTGSKDGEDKIYKEENLLEKEVCYILVIIDPWNYEMKYYLTHGSAPQYMEPKNKRDIILKSSQYQLVQGILLKKNYDGILLRCLEKDDAEKVLTELHDGLTGGNFGGDTTTHKILRAGYYWPTMFRDAHAYARKCEECQKSTGREKKHAFPFNLSQLNTHFNNGVYM